MEFEIGKFVLMYLLLPLITIVIAAVMMVVAKKNDLLNNKKLMFLVLGSCLLLALPALLGYIDYWFMPYAYVSLQVVYFILGWYYLMILKAIEKEMEYKPYYVEFLFVFIVMLVGAGLFSLIFNLCNELQYGLWACTCVLPFIFPSLFRKAYHSFMEIPLEIYKVWSYTNQDEGGWSDEDIDKNKIIVIELELSREISEIQPLNIKAKASENMPFGVWFKVFINDYNIKSSATPIMYSDYEDSYGWIFYRLSSILGRKKYIDTDLSLAKNKIKEHQVIMAKRAKYEDYNQLID